MLSDFEYGMNADKQAKFEKYLDDKHHSDINNFDITDGNSVFIDLQELKEYDEDLYDDLIHNPFERLADAEVALRKMSDKTSDANIRVKNHPNSVPVRGIREDHVNQVIAIEGTVSQRLSVQPMIYEAAYSCSECGKITSKKQKDKRPEKPSGCSNCQDGTKSDLGLRVDKSTFINYQEIIIQEVPDDVSATGANPEKITVTLYGDLTGDINPGERVTVTGILRAIPKDETGDIKNMVMDTLVRGSSIVTEEGDYEDIEEETTEEDIERIKELANSDDIQRKIVESIAPSIKGYETEKLAVGLQLFSGVKKKARGSEIRGDIHILLVGDPGTGKSVILRYQKDLSPRGMFSSGKGVTEAGLTATAVQGDDYGEDSWTLKAGVLPLCDQGIACVDELDKMKQSDQNAMLEALEQQTVSISKAGINTTMSSECSLLAAANPKKGRFEEHASIKEQIDLYPALISRFDLIFTFTDDQSEEKDEEIARHIVETNMQGQKKAKGEDIDDEPPIPKSLLKKYAAYARRNKQPTMDIDTAEEIVNTYVDIRDRGSEDTLSITARQLEAIIRLSEAFARMKLNDTIQEEDVENAVDIMMASLKQVGYDTETGEFDIDMKESGTSSRERTQEYVIDSIITRIEEENPKDHIDIDKVKEQASEENILESAVDERFEELERMGEAYQHDMNEGIYKMMSDTEEFTRVEL